MARVGCGPLAAFLIVLVVLVLIGGNEAIGYYFSHCSDIDVMDCLMGGLEEEPEEEGVVATGTYTYKGYDVNISAIIPLDGGSVTGTVSGTCDGTVKGNFSGQNNGVITGTMTGVCSPFFVNIPSSASFSGTVNKSAKAVPFSFSGRGGGISHDGSMTLQYQ
jgi:hypothetical protein